jgi:hypothetical protein
MKRKTMLDILTLIAKLTGDIKATLADMGERDRLICGTKASGQLRRRSMDLTRKLAELRAGK